jgi:predicted regulator of Ras-like GTPase activity (Roadblock/LC7/MglB family)
MSTVETQSLDTEAFLETGRTLVEMARKQTRDVARWQDAETIKFAEYWFAPQQRKDLARVANVIDRVEDDSQRRAFQIALSRIIVTKSPRASLAADTSHSRPHRVATESSYDVFAGFQQSVEGLKRRLEKRTVIGDVSVNRGDARKLGLPECAIDQVITSPPYLNAIDYMRGHKMSLIWLGYDIPTLRKIRSNSIGAERALDVGASGRVAEMVARIHATAATPESLPIATITRYAHDLELFAREVARVTKVGGEVVAVVGNSTLRGNYIRNDEIVQMALEQAGLIFADRTERDLPENRRYLPIGAPDSKSSMAKRMRKEIVLTVRKP